MTRKTSAGILLYRIHSGEPEVFLVHPGGPYWAKRDAGAWSIPKGEFEEGVDALEAARREFQEETGSSADGEFFPLTPVKQKSGKLVYAWALRGDIDASSVRSNTFAMEWPPHSGKQQEFPEVDRGAWFTVAAANEKILPGQRGFIRELQALLNAAPR
jgi:predicted NUDIX family NTP pyrophosphohydrolase